MAKAKADAVSERKIRKVSIKTAGLTRDEILMCIGNHVSACQRAIADLWAKEGETEVVTQLRESLHTASQAVR